MLNQYKTLKKLTIISKKIANLAEALSKRTKSVDDSSQFDLEMYFAQSNEDDCYGLNIDELITQETLKHSK